MLEQLASLIAVIGGLYAAWRALLRKYRARKGETIKNETDVLLERFLSLFTAHGIKRTQIPRFIGEQYLTLADVSTDEKLLHKLNEPILSAVCERFGVQRDWLDGKDVRIYQNYWFYQNMAPFLKLISEITSKYKNVEGFVIKSLNDHLVKSGDKDLPIALIFRAELMRLGDEPIYKYFIIDDDWLWDYKKSRLQLKAMFFIAFRFKTYIHGYEMPKADIEKIVSGNVFPGPIIDKFRHVSWHPDDYIFTSQESAVAKDDAEALEARELIKRYGLMKELEALTGPVEDIVRP